MLIVLCTYNCAVLLCILNTGTCYSCCIAGYCCGRKCGKEENNVPYTGTDRLYNPSSGQRYGTVRYPREHIS